MSAPDSGRARWPAWLAVLVVTTVVLGPLYVRGGIALRGDMVFVPDQPWKPAFLGLDGSVPRAVPMDALVSFVDNVIPGALLQRLLLTAAFLGGGLGIARLVRGMRASGQLAAVVVFLWNPWVDERLAIGQWATVLGYALLPWLVMAAARAREGQRGGWPATALLLVLSAVCAPSVGIVGVIVGVAVVGAGRSALRKITALCGLAVAANLPWILPAVLGPDLHASSAQFGDFAARGESSLGTLVSLLSMGGIWKTSIIPPERTHVVVVGAATALAVAFIVAFRYAESALGRATTRGVAAAGGASLVLAIVPAIGPVGHALGTMSVDWTALGLLRDSHRYLAPFGLVLAVGAAALVDRLVASASAGASEGARAGQDRTGRGAIAALLLIAPVVLLPSLAWGLAGALEPVSYPGDWSRVAGAVASGHGATVVLPWTGSYRGYGWNGYHAVLDPAPRFLPGDVLIDDRHFLRHDVVPGEDPFLLEIGDALHAADRSRALRELGVRWVLVEKGNGVAEDDVPVGATAFDGHWLRLVDLGAPTRDLGPLRPGPPRWIVVAGDVVAGFVGIVSVLQLGGLFVRTRR
ncbi:hypothetical protein ACVW00_002404 [Marmoricola sp. URHA0025 HA25]